MVEVPTMFKKKDKLTQYNQDKAKKRAEFLSDTAMSSYISLIAYKVYKTIFNGS